MTRKLITLIAILFAFPSHSLIGLNSYSPQVGTYQNDRLGGTESFSFNPGIAFNMLRQWSGNHYFAPEIGFVSHDVAVDDYSKSTTYILYDIAYAFSKSMYLRYGLGNFMTKISGDGGERELNNGTGTSTFYLPAEDSQSYNTTLNLGLEFKVRETISFRGEFFIFSPLSGDRNVSFLMGMNWYLK
jgi:hypothetical protein